MRNKPSVMLQMVCLLPLIWALPIAVYRWVTDREYFNSVPYPTFKDVYRFEWWLVRTRPYTHYQTKNWKTYRKVQSMLGLYCNKSFQYMPIQTPTMAPGELERRVVEIEARLKEVVLWM